ncbi:MAG: zf-HC2 domain-containing protein [Bacteroidales bacterium]|nr:zf-HC2 domain-containing protein [Bacteroidales bacterium]
MKHLNDKTIQNYIDNELPERERKELETHLEKCPLCKQKAESQRVFSDKLKKSLDTMVPENISVPEFSFRNAASPKVNITRIVFISSLSTACAIALIVFAFNWFSKPKSEPADFIFDYYTIEDYDANKPFAEQDFAEFKMRSQTEETDTDL